MLIYRSQFDFQSNISTLHAMLDVAPLSCNDIDDHYYTGLAFVEFKITFDAVSHGILLTKLNNYGIRGAAHTLIHFYFDNRQ